MKNEHIEQYIALRQSLTQKEWEDLNGLYDYHLHEKERQLTKNLSLNESETKHFLDNAKMLIGLDRQSEKRLIRKEVRG